ncbi:protein phosphatase 2C domain-containing protein [Streptomyces sp. L7]
MAKIFLDTCGAAAPDYATTLTVVVLTPAGSAISASVTASSSYAPEPRTGNGSSTSCRSRPPSASTATETVFLTSPDAPRRLHTDCVADPRVDGVLLSTDGLAQAAISTAGGGPPQPSTSFVEAVLRSLDTLGPVT